MINEKYSYKDFTGQTFVDVDPREFSDSEIHGSCFWHENHPDTIVFPKGVRNLVLMNCNACNVYLPKGITIAGSTVNYRIKTQNPTIDDPTNTPQDWILDENLNPIEPLHKEIYLKEGRSINPKDIAVDFYREEEIFKKDWDATYGKGQIPTSSWFREIPEIQETFIKINIVEVSQEKLNDGLDLKWDDGFTVLGTVIRYKYVALVNDKVQKLAEPISNVLVQLQGQRTRYKIRGRSWLYRGQEKE